MACVDAHVERGAGAPLPSVQVLVPTQAAGQGVVPDAVLAVRHKGLQHGPLLGDVELPAGDFVASTNKAKETQA